MKLENRALVCLLLIVVTATSAMGQSTARVTGSRGAVEVLDQAGTVNSIQTGANSSTTLSIGSDVTVSVGEQTAIEIRKLGISPVLWIDHGTIQVIAKSSEIQVQSKSGWFMASEWPLDVTLALDKGSASVTMNAGAIKTLNVDASGVFLRAVGNAGARTFTAGGNRQNTTKSPDAPPVYIQPVITFGGTTSPQAPATPSTPAVKTPASAKPPTP
jgi:hypothetical protein